MYKIQKVCRNINCYKFSTNKFYDIIQQEQASKAYRFSVYDRLTQCHFST